MKGEKKKMNFVYEYNENIRVSNKTLVKVYHHLLGYRYTICKIMAIIAIIMEVIMAVKGWYGMLIFFLCVDVIVPLLLRKQAISGARKFMLPLIGKKYEFTDDNINRDEVNYKYSEITELVEKKEFIIIKFGKKVLPMLITEDNEAQISELVEHIKRKSV